MRSTPRPRHQVSPAVLTALTPFFRHSISRDAYVLRGIGARVGPVLTERTGGRFSREPQPAQGRFSRDRDPEPR